VLAWQRAQDELFAEAAQTAFGGALRLIKNDRDAAGNIYGAQENYEATFAVGWRLAVWRAALVLLLPLAAITWLLLWMLDLLAAGYAVVATVIYLGAERLLPRPEWLARLLFGCSVQELSTDVPTGPAWLESILTAAARVVSGPLSTCLFCVLWVTAFSRIRRELTPFLISRPILGGAGMIDEQGQFHLSDKAPAMTCLAGLGGWLGSRPVYSLVNFLKPVFAESRLVWSQYRALFAPRQRLQIALGDSNLAEMAEYLRVGTTLLVLDAIEAGQMPSVPRVRRPIRSLRAVCGDPGLAVRIPLAGGGSATALEIQRFYLEACRRFLDLRPDAPSEAREVLRRWEDALDLLTDDPQGLVGTLDWVTKQFVLDKAGRGAAWEVRKKIDIRYHELSPQGYFQRLRTTGIVLDLLDRTEIEHARRNPPLDTPAAVRGRYIREWAADDEQIAANWQAIYLGEGREGRVVRLDQYHIRPTEPAAEQPRSPRNSDL
jgi:proteasome accessory factor A